MIFIQNEFPVNLRDNCIITKMNILIALFIVYKAVQGDVKSHFQLRNITLGCTIPG